MSKSYPVVEVLCNRCGDVTTIPLQYESELDRWLRAGNPGAIVEIAPRHGGWTIRPNNHSDYCPDCTRHYETTD